MPVLGEVASAQITWVSRAALVHTRVAAVRTGGIKSAGQAPGDCGRGGDSGGYSPRKMFMISGGGILYIYKFT